MTSHPSLDPTGMFRNRGRSRIPAANSNNASPPLSSAVANTSLIEAQSSGAPLNEWECQNRETIAHNNNVSACESAMVYNGESSSQSPLLNLNNNLNGHINGRDENVFDDNDPEASEVDSTVSILGSVIEDDLDVARWRNMKRAGFTDELVTEGKNEAVEKRVTDSDVATGKNFDAQPTDAPCGHSDSLQLAKSVLQSSLKAPKEGSQDFAHNDYGSSKFTEDQVVGSNAPAEKNVEEQPEGTSYEYSVPQSILEASTEKRDGIAENKYDDQFTEQAACVDLDGSVDKQLESDKTLQSEQSAPRSIVVKVADFSQMNGDGDINAEAQSTKHLKNDTILHGKQDTSNSHKSPLSSQSSPFRKAFRFEHNRRPTTPRLPSTIEARALLPWQLATKCFSFDDTTMDDNTIPYQYYGLSTASFPNEQTVVPLNRTKSFSGGYGVARRRRLEGENQSTFGVRRSKTWDHHIDGANNCGETYLQCGGNSLSQQNFVDSIQRRKFQKATSLLSCIVNQTLEFNHQSNSQSKSICCEKCMTESDNGIFSCERCSNRFKQTIDSMKKVCSFENTLNADTEYQASHEMRLDAMDVLMESYNFLGELNKIALAANEWLESHANGQSEKNTPEKEQSHDDLLSIIALKEKEISRLNSEVSDCRQEIGRLKSLTQPPYLQEIPKSMLSNSSDGSFIDASSEQNNSLILCSPHPVVKLSESNEESFARFERRMDADLKVESLKEIIRLKAALEEANSKIESLERSNTNMQNQEDPFPSDIEPITGSNDGEHDHNVFMKIAEDIENATYEPQIADRIALDDPRLEKELEEYRMAIMESVNARCVVDFAQDVSKSYESEAEQKMISVRMLDAENFVTEWDTVSPLPPPPDHGLHSPIVETILTRWTDDQETQDALLNWVESILNGSDNIPPLKIAGLDHQLKEGFIMHVFPLLLRRKDIHVHVTSRATRTTSYDLAVSISPSIESGSQANDAFEARGESSNSGSANVQPYNREIKHHLMAFKATCTGSTKDNDNSQLDVRGNLSDFPEIIRNESGTGSCFTAITTPISNRTPTKTTSSQTQRYMSNYLASERSSMDSSFPHEPQLPIMAGASPSLVDDLSVGSSADDEESSTPQSGLMNSIGGAFGLLSRSKKPPMPPSNTNGSMPNSIYSTPQRQAATSSMSPDDHGHAYHRLVSAPPGKIGLTFIEHRGHCMVSNVTNTSPLAGYVHPSDILIAIDDTPVSGLRTREIVRLLTEKKSQRRDLRMISSHDMNELIRPGTA